MTTPSSQLSLQPGFFTLTPDLMDSEEDEEALSTDNFEINRDFGWVPEESCSGYDDMAASDSDTESALQRQEEALQERLLHDLSPDYP